MQADCGNDHPWVETKLEPGELQVQWVATNPIRLLLSGDLDCCTFPTLARLLDQCTGNHHLRVELDLSGLELIDSRAAQWLYRQRSALRSAGGDLSVHSVSPWIAKVLRILDLTDLIGASSPPGKTSTPGLRGNAQGASGESVRV